MTKLSGDGNVSFEEFVDIMSNMTDTVAETSADQEERELRDAFRVFDKHNRGYITASDLRAVLQCLGEDLDEEESKFWNSLKLASILNLHMFQSKTWSKKWTSTETGGSISTSSCTPSENRKIRKKTMTKTMQCHPIRCPVMCMSKNRYEVESR